VGADVLILGSGPAGLLAAHAVEQLGGRIHIMSAGPKSVFQGAQYLHVPISGLTEDPHGVIRTYKNGTKEGYAQKVYGDPSAPCSWDDQLDEREAWDLRRVYDELWERYRPRIECTRVTWDDLSVLGDSCPLVISTIPAIHQCHQKREHCGDHEFNWEAMWTIDYAPPEVLDNTVLYSGDLNCDWYRSSRVFGHASTEFASNGPRGGAYLTNDLPPNTRVYSPRKGIKVQGTNCDCWPQIKRVGRFGTWRKGYLSHMAYHEAALMYEELEG
jgi:hypothetical protein